MCKFCTILNQYRNENKRRCRCAFLDKVDLDVGSDSTNHIDYTQKHCCSRFLNLMVQKPEHSKIQFNLLQSSQTVVLHSLSGYLCEFAKK